MTSRIFYIKCRACIGKCQDPYYVFSKIGNKAAGELVKKDEEE